MDTIISPAGSGTPNEAFGLKRMIRVSAADTDGAFAVFEENIPEGAGPPLHVHHGEIEMFTVVDGKVRFRSGDQDLEAGPGDVVVIPAGHPHTFKGLAPMSRALVQLTPGHAAGFFPAVTAENLNPADHMDRIVELAKDYNLEFVGPPLD